MSNGRICLNFRQKLQLSFIGILLFSFLLIGIVVAYLTVNQFHSKHYENIKEKLNSFIWNLITGFHMEKQVSTDLRNNSYSSLNELLIKLSNTFNTDINLYDLNGFLIATSRPEIFYRNLTSRRINNMAFINLVRPYKERIYPEGESWITGIYFSLCAISWTATIKFLHI